MANEYISPTSFNDPNGSWSDEPKAYDGNIASSAVTSIPAHSWSNFLELLHPDFYCSKIKFYTRYHNQMQIDIDVYSDGAWGHIFQGSYLDQVWMEKVFPDTYKISKVRFRIYNASSQVDTGGMIEFMFYETVGYPVVTTNAATDVAGDEATLHGSITNTGGEAPTTRGFKYKEGIAGAEVDASDSGYFPVGVYSKTLTGLDPTKKYYFRAYATNTAGTGYGATMSFGVDVDVPTVTTSAATSVVSDSATLNGNMTETGGGDATERGFEWKIGATGDIETLPETGTFGVGAYSLVLEGLSANIEYYFRAYAVNGAGTAYGEWLTFTTIFTDPTVITHNATDELATQVTGNGQIVSTGGKDCDERGFEYGLSKTPTWLKNEVAGGYGVGFFDLDITGLTPNTEYWYRAYAIFYKES